MILNNLDLLEHVSGCLQKAGLVSSQSAFSVQFLEKSGSYLSSMSARNRSVPDSVTTTLEWTLMAQAFAHKPNEEHGASDRAQSDRQRYELLMALATVVRRHRAGQMEAQLCASANDSDDLNSRQQRPGSVGDTGFKPEIIDIADLRKRFAHGR